VKCKKRKGKRLCPALSGSICPLCCGIYREKEIDCPDSCIYLRKHRSYQEKKDWMKQVERKDEIRKKYDEIYGDEKMAWLAFNIEKTIKIYADSNSSLNDRKVIKSLEYTLNKIKREKILVGVTKEEIEEKNELGEIIYGVLENIKSPQRLIVPEAERLYRKEEKIKCLENLIALAKLFSMGELDRRNFIERIGKRVEEIFERKKDIRLVTPF
jgi:hypothetical protein